jgi:hypothetical protein
MATLITTDGTASTVTPLNGTDFSLEELKSFVHGYIELVYLNDGKLMVINENGKYEGEYNLIATDVAHRHHAIESSDYIAGDALICLDKEVR